MQVHRVSCYLSSPFSRLEKNDHESFTGAQQIEESGASPYCVLCLYCVYLDYVHLCEQKKRKDKEDIEEDKVQ